MESDPPSPPSPSPPPSPKSPNFKLRLNISMAKETRTAVDFWALLSSFSSDEVTDNTLRNGHLLFLHRDQEQDPHKLNSHLATILDAPFDKEAVRRQVTKLMTTIKPWKANLSRDSNWKKIKELLDDEFVVPPRPDGPDSPEVKSSPPQELDRSVTARTAEDYRALLQSFSADVIANNTLRNGQLLFLYTSQKRDPQKLYASLKTILSVPFHKDAVLRQVAMLVTKIKPWKANLSRDRNWKKITDLLIEEFVVPPPKAAAAQCSEADSSADPIIVPDTPTSSEPKAKRHKPNNMARCTKVWPRVLLFGDSITQRSFSPDACWGGSLADYLQRKCDVVSRGFSGYNTKWCKVILPSIIDKQSAKDIQAMTLFLGANDSNEPANERQHVPLDEYINNTKEMVNYVLSTGVSKDKIILITPPAFDAEAWGEECRKKGRELTKNNQTTGLYAKACHDLAKTMGTPVVDLYSEMMKAGDFRPYLNDGLHLSPSGSQLLFDLLRPLIDQLTSDLPQAIFPFYDQVDLDNVEKSLLQ